MVFTLQEWMNQGNSQDAKSGEVEHSMRKDPLSHKRVTETSRKDGRNRSGIFPGAMVRIVKKQDQGTGRLTEGKVKEVLTNSTFHPHGIKVRLEDGSVGRVREFC